MKDGNKEVFMNNEGLDKKGDGINGWNEFQFFTVRIGINNKVEGDTFQKYLPFAFVI